MILIVNRQQREALDFLYDRLKTDAFAQGLEKNKIISFRGSVQGRFYHSLAVLYYAREIVTKVICNREVVEMAAILHDIGKIVDSSNHAETGAVIAGDFLKEQGYSQQFIDQVANCIRLHNLKGRTPHAPIEVKVIQDADLLDKNALSSIKQVLSGKVETDGKRKELKKIMKRYEGDLYEYASAANFPFVQSQILDIRNKMEQHVKGHCMNEKHRKQQKFLF